jgi:hypothetical protein
MDFSENDNCETGMRSASWKSSSENSSKTKHILGKIGYMQFYLKVGKLLAISNNFSDSSL